MNIPTNDVRESIKQKLSDTYPDGITEVTAPELSYVLNNPDDFDELRCEVESEKKAEAAKRSRLAEFLHRGITPPTPEQLRDELKAIPTSEPQTFGLRKAAKPLMDFIAEHYSDETIALVGANGAEVVTTVKSIFRD